MVECCVQYLESMFYVYMHLDVSYVIGSSQLYVECMIHACYGFKISFAWLLVADALLSLGPDDPLLFLYQLVGFWEKLQETPIFPGKIYGFRLRFSLEPTN